MADTTLTPDQIISDFGAYYIDSGQGLKDLHLRPFQPFETLENFTIIPETDTIFRASDVQVGEILQSYQDTFTPKGSTSFKGIVINMFNQKIDQAFNPQKLVKSWLGFLTSNSTNRIEWPFVRWFIEAYILKQSDKDLEMSAIYGGSYVAPTEGTANTAAQSMDGIKKFINAGIADSRIVPIATGSLSTNPVTFVGQIETFFKGIPEIYWSEKIVFNMSKSLQLRFREGVRSKYNMYYAQQTELDQSPLFPNFSVAGRYSQNGSSKIWGTPKWNAWAPIKGYENKNAFQIEKVDRKVKIYTDWWMGVGFLLYDVIFTNDLETS
jgi:hypothetical protein